MWSWVKQHPRLMIFVVALALRLLVFASVAFDESRMSGPDAEDYQRRAVNLLHHGVFSGLDLTDGVREPEGPIIDRHHRVIATAGPYLYDVHRTPGYPAFVAAVYRVCGERPMWVALVQCVLGALTCVVAFQLAEFLGSRHAAIWAGFALAIELFAILLSNALITETVFTLLLTCGLLALFHAHRTGKLLPAMTAGLCVGLGILCRPIGLYLIALPTIWLAVSGKQTRSRRCQLGAAFCLCAIATIAPWMARNYAHFGQWQFTSIQGLNLYSFKSVYVETGSLGRLNPNRIKSIQDQMAEEFATSLNGRRLNYLEMAREYQRAGLERISSHPIKYGLAHLSGTVTFFGLMSPHTLCTTLGVPIPALVGNEEQRRADGLLRRVTGYLTSVPAWFLALYVVGWSWSTVIILLAGWGVVSNWRDPALRPYVVLLSLCVAYFCLSAGPQGDSRFRAPTMPMMAVLGGYALQRWRNKASRLACDTRNDDAAAEAQAATSNIAARNLTLTPAAPIAAFKLLPRSAS